MIAGKTDDVRCTCHTRNNGGKPIPLFRIYDDIISASQYRQQLEGPVITVNLQITRRQRKHRRIALLCQYLHCKPWKMCAQYFNNREEKNSIADAAWTNDEESGRFDNWTKGARSEKATDKPSQIGINYFQD